MTQQTDKDVLGKRIRYMVCMVVFAVGLLISSLTLAYFSSKDEVTNTVSAYEVEIELLENNWYDHGINDANNLQPGMIIDKDPKTANKSRNSVYVRMRFEIQDEDGKKITDTDRYNAILSAIYLDSKTPFAEITENEDETYSYAYNLNDGFIYDESDDWFYYETKSYGFTPLLPGEETPLLFSSIKIPVLKTDYNGIFDEKFSIFVEAQAIAVIYNADETPTRDDLVERFEEQYENK